MALHAQPRGRRVPVLGVTGTGGAGKSSLTDELIRRYVPDLPRTKPGLSGNWAGMDPTKAERVLGLRAAHLMERYVGPDGDPLG